MSITKLGTFVAGVSLVAASAFGEQPSRLPQDSASPRVAVRGNVHPLAVSGSDEGAVAGSVTLPTVTLFLNRTASQQADLDELLSEQQEPKSANYHKWLTPQQFADRFSLSASDFQKVVDWLKSQGFSIAEESASRSYVVFSCTAAQIRSSFGTAIHNYVVRGESHIANASEPQLPSSIAGVVLGFRGLNDFRPKPKAVRTSAPFRAHFTSSISGNHFISPDDFATIYSLKPLYDKGYDGTGVTIAVMGQTDLLANDITAFRSVSGLSPNPVHTLLVPSSADPGVSSNDIAEADLDVEWSGAVARGATILFVNSTNVFNSLQYAITQNLAPVISISYGDCEQNLTSAEINSLSSLAQQANAQGITIVAASGDSGAADCDYPTGSTAVTSATHGLAVDAPASIPNVTGIGGTQFNDTSNASTYWSSVNNSLNGSVLSYIPEIAWNETSTELSLGGSIAAGGGGASTVFTKPTWQTGTGVPSDGQRDVPDLSFHASFDSDGLLICSQGSCVNGYRRSDSTLDVVGGTSAGAPTFAGIVAILNQITGSRQGNLNQHLYQLAASSTDAFNDITSGNNRVPCTSGSTGCPSSGQIGYTAGTGYDQATGLGTINAYNFALEWNSSATSTSPAPDFSITSSASTLALTSGNSGSVTVTVQALNGFTNNVALTCSVPSSLTSVSCSITPNTIAGSGTATVKITSSTSSSAVVPPLTSGQQPLFALLPTGIALLIVSRSRKRLAQRIPKRGAWFGAALCLLVAVIFTGCGGGGSSSPSSNTSSTTNTTTTSSTSTTLTGTVVIQGTSNADIHATALAVTVN